MKRYGVTPNLLVIPPQLALYMSLAPDEKITYKEGGPAAIANFEAGVEGFTTRAFRGCGVVTSEPFEVSDEMEAVQMLQRFTQVGEFYVMSPPTNPPADDTVGAMDLLIYDEESDRHVKITWESALAACCYADALAAGGTDPEIGKKTDGSVMKLSDWKGAADAWSGLNKKWVQATADTTEPVCIVLARPFIEHAMLSAVLTVSGGDTGATIFGPSDMQISANTSVKTIEGHYTGHFKSVITKHQNVFVMKDIMASGYRAGGNTKFFGTDKDTVRDNLMARLNMDDTTGDAVLPSMLAFPMAYSQYDSGNMDIAMSVTTRFLPYEVASQSHNSFPGGQAMFKKYDEIFGLRAVHFGEDLRASENMEYMSQGSTNNSLCFLGPHRKYDGISKTYTQLIPGMGHWGPDARPGDVSRLHTHSNAYIPPSCVGFLAHPRISLPSRAYRLAGVAARRST